MTGHRYENHSTFDAAGPLDAPVIVLIHGGVLTRKMWLPQLRALSDEFRIIAPDLPGHGALAGMPFQLDSAVGVIADIVDTHAGGHALIVGMSLGGYVATAFGRRYPSKAAGLVVSGATANPRGVMGLWFKTIGFLTTRVMSERWLKRGLERRMRGLFPSSLDDVAREVREAGFFPKGTGQFFLEAGGQDFARMLSGFPGPVLILNGENDAPNRKGERAFAAANEHVRIQTIMQARHACSIDQPEAFSSAVRDFARTIS